MGVDTLVVLATTRDGLLSGTGRGFGLTGTGDTSVSIDGCKKNRVKVFIWTQ